MKKLLILTAGVILAAAPLCAAEPAPQAKANAAAGRFNLEMRKIMVPSIRQHGLAGSLDVCAKDAPRIMAEQAKSFNLAMKRTALRVRNPANAPDPAEKALMEQLMGMLKGDEPLPQDATLFSDTEVGKERILRYYKPIMVQAPCLGCHGMPDKIPADVKAILAQRYPKDKGAGYKEGELRGIISIIVKEKLPEKEVKK